MVAGVCSCNSCRPSPRRCRRYLLIREFLEFLEFLGNTWLIRYENHYPDTWFVLQTPIEFGSSEIVIIKSIDTNLKVITSVLYIPSFQWFLRLILHIVVHVVSFFTISCDGNQLQPLKFILFALTQSMLSIAIYPLP
jgi:hypothetical protein